MIDNDSTKYATFQLLFGAIFDLDSSTHFISSSKRRIYETYCLYRPKYFFLIENWIISSFYTPNRAHLSTYQLAPSSIHATHFSTLTGSCHVTKIKPTPTKTPTKGHSRAETTDFHEKNIFLRRPPRWWSRVFRFFCWWRWRMSWWMAADWRSSK